MLLVESLRRLYTDNKIDIEKINQLVVKGIIDEKDRKYILGKEE